MGPGVDLDILAEQFNATGSDFSPIFLDRYRETHPDADLIELDAMTLSTDRTFDAIYSNKVLHHLNDGDLSQSILRQNEILNHGGIVMHSFWNGDQVEEHAGMNFYYRNQTFLESAFSPGFKILGFGIYAEMENSDSIYVVARRN
jgi:trans-aconitate methyltransferase